MRGVSLTAKVLSVVQGSLAVMAGVLMCVGEAFGQAQQPPAAPPPPPAQTAPAAAPAPVPIGNLSLQNASLVEVINQLARQLKINYILDPAVKGSVVLNSPRRSNLPPARSTSLTAQRG